MCRIRQRRVMTRVHQQHTTSRQLQSILYVAGNLRIDCPKQEQQEGRSSLLERACARGLG